MTTYAANLEARKQSELTALAAATCPEARGNIASRLQRIKQLLAEHRAEQSQYSVPRPCAWLK